MKLRTLVGFCIPVWLGLTPAPAAAVAAGSAPTATETRPAALRVPGPLSPRNASYRLKAELDATTHRVVGSGTLTWRNLERQPATELVFHLYQNAFKSFASTYIFEAGAQLRGDSMPEHGFGSIDVATLKVNGRDLRHKAVVDDTLLTVPLDTPIGPSATVEVELTWTVQLPRVFARSGWYDSFHAVSQWFPKIGVYDCDEAAASPAGCRWRANQYHGVTEFFADYGVYDVTIDVPAAMVVGATGVQVAAEEHGGPNGQRKLLTYHAEDVHDFAFFADPQFVEVHDEVEDDLGRVSVRLLTRRGQEPYNARHFAPLRLAIQEAGRRLGSYPYSNLTVVVPPGEARGAAGMEYPTLIASIALPLPASIHGIEETTVHEFMHQYFYGMLGSDEVEDAWLDEGMTQAFTSWVMDRYAGERCSQIDLGPLCIAGHDVDWIAYRATTRQLPIATRSYSVPVDLYGPVSYAHPAVMMDTLARYLGEERMTAALHRYADRFRFRHPRKADFVAAMSEGAGEDLRWFFRQALDSTRVADYQVLDLDSKGHKLAAGLWDCPPAPLPPGAPSGLLSPTDKEAWRALVRDSQQAVCAEGGGKPLPDFPGRRELVVDAHDGKESKADKRPTLYDSEVTIQRRGDFLFPVDITVVFEDGSSERTTWTLAEQESAPEARIKTLRYYRRPTAVARADVDPEGTLVLDERRVNNSRFSEPHRRPVARLFFSLVGALQTLLDLVGV